jgi:hypothetical protein
MGRWLLNRISKLVVLPSLLVVMAFGQAPPTLAMVPHSTDSMATGGEAAETKEASDTTLDPASLLPDPPSLPSKNTSLIGGTIEKLDRVRDQFTIRVFGGGKVRMCFDPRTHIYSDGNEVTASNLHPGDRVYVDTILSGGAIFARNIRLKTAAGGESRGLVMSYRSDNGELTVRDALSPEPLKLRVTPQTSLVDKGHTVAATDLVPGALVTVNFSTPQNGRAVAREISILAVPGTSFTFVGRVTGLDLSSGLLTLTSATDGKSYEIYLDPSAVTDHDRLRQAADVTVLALFEGNRYVARNVTVN